MQEQEAGAGCKGTMQEQAAIELPAPVSAPATDSFPSRRLREFRFEYDPLL